MPVGGKYPYPEEEITQHGWDNSIDSYRATIVDSEGRIVGPNNPLSTTASITISGDLEIGAVEIKDGTTDKRAIVDDSGNLHIKDISSINSITSGNQILLDIRNDLQGVISINNSTTTTLSASGVFEGSADLSYGYGIAYVNIFSDVESAIDGLQILQSSDGSNWDHKDYYSIPANIGKNFSINPCAKYLKIRYINGINIQSEFRLQTIFKINGKASSHRIQDTIIHDDDAELVKNVQAFYNNNDDNYKNVSIQNPLPVDGDSVYSKDIWENKSNLNGFSGRISDLFDNLHSTIIDSTSTNPKSVFIHFNRTIVSNVVGLGAYQGNFSNVKISIYNSGEVYSVVYDGSTNNTKYTTKTYQLPATAGFNAIKFEFYTSDTVTLSNVVILKTENTVSRLQAKDENNIVQDINCNLAVDKKYYLNVSTIQNFFIDVNNSSIENLTSANSYTFAGSATEIVSTNAIQVLLKTNQNASIYIDQSSDGNNWDITDTFMYYYSKGGLSKTIKSIGNYYKIRVILNGMTDTTYFRLQSKLIPISEPLPESLDNYDRLKTTTGIVDLETGKRAEIEPLGSLKVVTPVRLIGTPFNNGTKDTNFWSEVVVGSGTVAQCGQIILSTGTTANSSAQYNTIHKARKVTGTTNQFRMVGRLVTPPQENNVRRAGCYNDDNGFFFQINGTTFGVGSRKNGIDTIVNDGDFNGNYGNGLTISTLLGRFIIEYTSISSKFFYNDILLHTISSEIDSIVNTLDLPIRMENYNINGNTTNNSFQVRFATIVRLGEQTTIPIYKYIGTNTTTICKYGSGVLQRLNITENLGTLVIYDNTSATGTIIASIDASKTPGTLEFNAPFSNGLTIVSSGNSKCTVIYE